MINFYVARLSAEKVITIIIEDTNDNSPEFVSVPTGLLSPATSPGAKITTVLATDRWEKTPASVCICLQGSWVLPIAPVTLPPQYVTYDKILLIANFYIANFKPWQNVPKCTAKQMHKYCN
jgi:hypothetical protein